MKNQTLLLLIVAALVVGAIVFYVSKKYDALDARLRKEEQEVDYVVYPTTYISSYPRWAGGRRRWGHYH